MYQDLNFMPGWHVGDLLTAYKLLAARVNTFQMSLLGSGQEIASSWQHHGLQFWTGSTRF